MANDLVEIFKVLNNKEYHLAILLDHQYTHRSFSENGGVKALKGADHKRYSLLAQANQLLPEDKQLVFYICSATLKMELTMLDKEVYKKSNYSEDYDDDDEDDDEEMDKASQISEESIDSIESDYSQDSNDSNKDYICSKYEEKQRQYYFADWYQ